MMNMEPRDLSVTILLLFSCAMANSSESHSAPAPPPTYSIDLTRVAGVEMSYGPNLPFVPKQCSRDGSPYVWALGESGMQVVRLGPESTTIFSTNKITDVAEPRSNNFSVSESAISIVVSENNKKPLDTSRDQSSSTGESKPQYIARFREDGTYQGAVHLDLPLVVEQLAQFGNGDYLVAGVDDHKRQRLAIVDSGGQLSRFVELTAEAPAAAHGKASKRSNEISIPPQSIGLFTQLYSYQGDVMFISGSRNNDITLIRSGGNVRVVHVHGPGGATIDHIIPSDTDWFVDFARNGNSDSAHSIYAVSPQTGALVTHYVPRIHSDETAAGVTALSGDLIPQISCSVGQEFTAIVRSDDKLVLLKGAAQQP